MKRLFFAGLFVLILQFAAFAQSGEFDLGISSANSGDFQTALQHFQKSLDKSISVKKSAQIHYNLGVCFYQLKQTNAAITEFEQAAQLFPQYAKAFYALGMAHTDLRNFNEAEDAFRQSLKLSNNGETWFDLALVLFELKKYDDSAQSFENAIKFGSVAVAASHNNLGVVYAMQGNLHSAKKELEISEKLNFIEAANNLNIVRNALATNDKTLIAKLILKGK